MTDLFDNLNPQQHAAVTAPDGPVLVLAGPGAGKTRVITLRIAYLIEQRAVPPHSIMAVTFTNKAAREMRERVEHLQIATKGLAIGTFHSICARLLRRDAERLGYQRDFVIYDSSDQDALLREVMTKQLRLDPRNVPPGAVHSAISRAKNELISPEEYVSDTYFNEIAGRVYKAYQAGLRMNNALDFDDLLMQVVVLLRDHPPVREFYQRSLQHLLIDEFQDTNTAQYTLATLLAGDHRNLFAVGDEDQSIYRWRGADYRNVTRFRKDFPDAQVVLLERNYRSTQVVLDAAMGVIKPNPGRIHKELFTERQGGERVYLHEAYDDYEEARWIVEQIALLTLQEGARSGDVAVMYRTNSQSRVLEDAFVKAGLPYRLVGATRFYGRREVKDLLAYLRLIHNPADSVSLFRVINVPTRGIGATTAENLRALAEQRGVSPGAVLLSLGREGRDSPYAAALPNRAFGPLATFGEKLALWVDELPNRTAMQMVDLVLDSVSYKDFIDDGTKEGEDRWDNVMELRGVAHGYNDLATFLEDSALVSEVDNLTEDANAPTLLTLHAAKGLEFPIVFIVGLDEGVLPHQRSVDDPEQLAEERRLFYVGLTRAKDRIFLTRAHRRGGRGMDIGVSIPSRFLNDIPTQLLSGHVAPASQTRQHFAQQHIKRVTSWETAGATPRWARPMPTAEPTFGMGQGVRHAEFGDGVVLETQFIGNDEIVTVAFKGKGIKRLSLAIAKLTPTKE